MTANWSAKLIALLLTVTVGFPLDGTSDTVSEYLEANLHQIKKSYSSSLETPEDTAIDNQKISSIDDSATLSRTRADFLDFFNESKSDLFSESLLVSYVDLISEGTYVPSLLSSLLLNIPPPVSLL
ncbi:hypothetical protein ND861_15360 [Leptospira sp. 2 VSF19]|uniref:Uncharacterized protein n=1 Tax=Leptospira soteropolitanensis TaxID=2950025 RepID=A0AAW5VGM8_9LEPT|nr:hypothetical protein [Leptospira soteropolitanensis]MCW7494024.1 hypothetical protein [Leptospira soteropolitanensis]MCW7501710.1 hypothetical protein [Leptospira soteropolitanensis]MCW7523870.1 hypothetical protein [Leptospira soteropolitanensis]MCW7527735.1 hypothetical protein [Leptospira soteropolitanensis]MCW7531680.1 hypothetical protein [Leptospira soteropolitanensis]